jgi:hypothetical protein
MAPTPLPFPSMKIGSKGLRSNFLVNREREKALVVSSDLDIVNFAAANGAATIRSPDFEEKMTMAVYMETKGVEREDQGEWLPTTKKKGPSKRLSKRKRRNRIKIKKL